MSNNSIVDIIARQLAPVYRKLNDLYVNTTLGVECNVLYISRSVDVFGDTTETLTSNLINNVIINHPYGGNVELFEIYKSLTQQIQTGSIDIWEVLPITMKVPLQSDKTTTAMNIKRGDLIVEVLFDEHGNKIPIVMEVTKIFGTFLVKELIAKKYELTLFRGQLSDDILTIINTYITNLRN